MLVYMKHITVNHLIILSSFSHPCQGSVENIKLRIVFKHNLININKCHLYIEFLIARDLPLMYIIDCFFLTRILNSFDLSTTFILNNNILFFKLVDFLYIFENKFKIPYLIISMKFHIMCYLWFEVNHLIVTALIVLIILFLHVE